MLQCQILGRQRRPASNTEKNRPQNAHAGLASLVSAAEDSGHGIH
jgi:hypothetical protein